MIEVRPAASGREWRHDHGYRKWHLPDRRRRNSAFAIQPDTWEVLNLNIVGYIMIIGGIIALVLGLVYNSQRQRTHHTVERYDDRPPPVV